MVATIILSIYLAFASRIHGGLLHFAKGWKNALWALPFGITAAFVFPLPYPSIIAGIISFAGAFLKGTGHGGGIDLGHNPKEPKNGRSLEVLERLIYPWIFNRVNRYTYDAILLSLTGLAAVVVPALVIGYHSPIAGAVVAAGGLFKGFAYMIGWALFPDPADDRNTETGEFLTGLFAGACLGLAVMIADKG